jgi:hypothetical protein
MLELSEFLEPGFYSLSIKPGRAPRSNTSLFPSCVYFAFEMRMVLENDESSDPVSDQECWEWPQLPTTLDQPHFLDNPSHQAYDCFFCFFQKKKCETQLFVNRYLSGIFGIDGGVYRHTITFSTGTGDYMLRAYVDPNEDTSTDFDLGLMDDQNTIVATSLNGGALADQIVFRLKEKSSYTLSVVVSRSGGTTRCTSFGFEMAVEPVPQNLWSGACAVNDLPPANFFPEATRPFDFIKTYFFTQRIGRQEKFTLDLVVTAPSFVRAQISYEFIWGALSLTLMDKNQNVPVTMGTGGSNSNNLGSLRLEPGSYSLVIEHSSIPFVITQGDALDTSARCASFTLHGAIDDAEDEVTTVGDENPCRLHSFPASLSSPASVHPLGGNMFRFTRHVLVNVDSRRDSTVFTLTEPTLLRVFIPDLDVIDVDMSLRPAEGPYVFQVTNTGENQRVRKLDAGTYTFATRYFPQVGANNSLPHSACLWFPLQMELIPMARVLASPAHVGPALCEKRNPPTTWVVGSSGSDDFSHPVGASATKFVYNISLHLTTVSVLRLTVDSEFATGYVWFQVFRESDAANVKHLEPVMSDSGAFFFDELEPGDWTVQLYHPIGDDVAAQPTELSCSTFSLRYELSGSVSPSSCHLLALPTEFTSIQRPDGGFFVSGDLFRAPAKGIPAHILFSAPKKRLVFRAFAQSNGNSRIDIDFVVYSNASLSRVVGSFGLGSPYEDAFVVLEPQPVPYVLQVKTYSLKHLTSVDCPSIFLAVAAEPVDVVMSRRQCPAVLPTNSSDAYPPVTINIPAGETSYTFDQRTFVLTSDMLASHLSSYLPFYNKKRQFDNQRYWWFKMNLEVREETILRVSLGSNFLAADALLYNGPRDWKCFGAAK